MPQVFFLELPDVEFLATILEHVNTIRNIKPLNQRSASIHSMNSLDILILKVCNIINLPLIKCILKECILVVSICFSLVIFPGSNSCGLNFTHGLICSTHSLCLSFHRAILIHCCHAHLVNLLLFLLLLTSEIFVVQGVTVFSFKSQKLVCLWKQVEVSNE